MKTFPRYTAAVIVALAVAGSVGIARANPMGGGPAGPMGHMCSDMDARMAARFAYAEVKLGLGDAQKTAFARMKETMAAAHAPMKQVCTELAAQPPAATMPARMAQMQKMMETRVETMRKVIPAMTGFYDTLTPDQRKIADSMMMGRHGHHMGH
jgi:protein CpxP